MLRVVRLILLVLLLSPSAWGGCGDPFATPEQIVEFHIELTQSSWDQLRSSEPTDDSCDGQYPYFEARFRCGDEAEWLTIGVRRKRDRSGSDFKPPLKLDFNRFVTEQRWPAARGELGFRKLTLNSGQPDDPGGGGNGGDSAPGVLSALITEYMGWRLMREEVPEAGGVAYAKLYLHFSDSGQQLYQGVHALIEDIDRTAVRARFGVDQGALFKTTWADCRDEVVFDDGPPNVATDAFEGWTELDPTDFTGSWYQRTDQVMRLDALLRQEALRELFANTEDTVLGRMSNFFALDLYGQRRTYLPWDLDDMFRPQPQIRSPELPFVSSCVGQGNTCAPIPLGVNIRDNAELRPFYLKAMCDITNGTGNEGKVLAQWQAIDALLRPAIAEEVPTLWEPQGLDPLDADTPGTYAAEFERMHQWIPDRVQAVRRMIEEEGVSCEAGCEEGTTIQCETLAGSVERVCTGGTFAPCVAPAAVPGPAPAGVAGAPASDSDVSDAAGCGCRTQRSKDVVVPGLVAFLLFGVCVARRRLPRARN